MILTWRRPLTGSAAKTPNLRLALLSGLVIIVEIQLILELFGMLRALTELPKLPKKRTLHHAGSHPKGTPG